MKIRRDAFLYLDPQPPDEEFAQCGTCRLFLPESKKCGIIGDEVSADASCGLYVHGEPTEDQPGTRSATAEEAGVVHRQVRCENCASFDGSSGCNLFEKLNKALPDLFELDSQVKSRGCCNAQTPKGSDMAGDDWSDEARKVAADARRHKARDEKGYPDDAGGSSGAGCAGGEDISSHGALKAAHSLSRQGRDGARDSLVAALKQKFSTPRAAMAALGLDSTLLGANKEVEGMTHLSHVSALRIAGALKARGKLAMDADPEEIAKLLEKEEVERSDDTEPNAGMPPWLDDHREEDHEFESPEEYREDEVADRRAYDLSRRLGRPASDSELEREEEMEFKPDTDKAALDRRRIRADDARKRLGRDEFPDEKEKREKEDEAEDRRRAMDRLRMSRDYRSARDRHRRAMDAVRRHADDFRRADDAMKQAKDAKRADDARKAEDAMKRHAADGESAYEEMCAAKDARARARDARRADDRHADDRRRAADQPPPFKGMPQPGGEMVSKSAMDQAIQSRVNQAIRDNDNRHREIAEAMEAVRTKVGRIAMDSSIQNAGDVYARALDVLTVPHAGVTQIAALKQMFAMAPRPGGDRDLSSGFAQDAAPTQTNFETFRKMFGDHAAAIERT